MTSDGNRTSVEGGPRISRRAWLAATCVSARLLATGRPAPGGDSPDAADDAYLRWLWELTGPLAVPSDPDNKGVRVHFGASRIAAGVVPRSGTIGGPVAPRKTFDSIRLGELIQGVEPLDKAGKISYVPVELPAMDATVETIWFYKPTDRPQVLRVGEPGACTLLVVPVLEGRQTDVAVYRDPGGWLRIAFFASRLGIKQDREALRSLGETQWHLVNRNSEAARLKLAALPDAGRNDPIALCLSAYIATIRGDYERLDEAVKSMKVGEFEIADRYVARATLEEARDRPRSVVEDSYRSALAAGLPLIGPFLDTLWQGYGREKHVSQRYGDLLREAGPALVRNQIWSAWRA
jgi:hypothetical protein